MTLPFSKYRGRDIITHWYDAAADMVVLTLSDGTIHRMTAQDVCMTGGIPHLGGLPFGGLGQMGLGNNSIAASQQNVLSIATVQPGILWNNGNVLAHTPIAAGLPRWLKPDPKQPDTLGWRSWIWHDGHQFLVSPHQQTGWPNAEHKVPTWTDEDAVRGVAGIHARLVPRHWKIVGWPDDHASSGLDANPNLVTGIVERFGRYVLGTEGWRAEQVTIRELLAPSTEIGLALEQLYPDAIVHYSDQIEEGETPCKSEKSSALEKGNRSLPPSQPPAQFPPNCPPLHPLLRFLQSVRKSTPD